MGKKILNSLTNISIDELDSKKSVKLSKEEKLIKKYKGKKVVPKLEKAYWELSDNRGKKRDLIIDNVKYSNLGRGCEKTLMLHFEGDPIKKWEIGKHFTLCK